MNLRSRSYTKELLDQDNIAFEDIRKNMQELNFINTWLGGHGITIKGLKKLLGLRSNIIVCETGCGGGDNIAALHQWCLHQNINVHFIGIDIKAECIEFAKNRHPNKNITWIVSDYDEVKFYEKPDVIFSSLFCHHFNDDELIQQLQWMRNNSKAGFFINDLQRHTLAYYSIKLLTGLFSSSYLVKNDAPLSVARGFKKHEWQLILNKAGLTSANISWQWAFRYLIVYKH